MFIINDEKPIREGLGGNSVVFMGLKIDDNTNEKADVAIKRVNVQKVVKESKSKDEIEEKLSVLRELLECEAELHGGLSHDNIARVVAFQKIKGVDSLVIEYIKCGSVSARREQRKRAPFNFLEAIDLLFQLSRAFAYLHGYLPGQVIVHNDTHPGNVLYDSDGVIKIADFGLAKRASIDVKSSLLTSGCPEFHHPLFSAPECSGPGKVFPSSDLWSVGLIFCQFLVRIEPLYKGVPVREIIVTKKKEVLDHIENKITERFSDAHESASGLESVADKSEYLKKRRIAKEECIHLVRALLEPDPAQRIFLDGEDLFNFLTQKKSTPSSAIGEVLLHIEQSRNYLALAKTALNDAENFIREYGPTKLNKKGEPEVAYIIWFALEKTQSVVRERQILWDYNECQTDFPFVLLARLHFLMAKTFRALYEHYKKAGRYRSQIEYRKLCLKALGKSKNAQDQAASVYWSNDELLRIFSECKEKRMEMEEEYKKLKASEMFEYYESIYNGLKAAADTTPSFLNLEVCFRAMNSFLQREKEFEVKLRRNRQVYQKYEQMLIDMSQRRGVYLRYVFGSLLR